MSTDAVVKVRAGWLDWLRGKTKTGRERAQARLERERDNAGLWGLGDLLTDSVSMMIVAMVVTAFMVMIAVAYFSHPGVVEWAGALLAQNCVVNHVCDWNANLAAFAVANVVLIELVVSGSIMFLRAGSQSSDDLEEQLAQLDNAQMAIVGEVGDLKDQVEALRHELLADPPGPAASDEAEPDEQPY